MPPSATTVPYRRASRVFPSRGTDAWRSHMPPRGVPDFFSVWGLRRPAAVCTQKLTKAELSAPQRVLRCTGTNPCWALTTPSSVSLAATSPSILPKVVAFDPATTSQVRILATMVAPGSSKGSAVSRGRGRRGGLVVDSCRGAKRLARAARDRLVR